MDNRENGGSNDIKHGLDQVGNRTINNIVPKFMDARAQGNIFQEWFHLSCF